MLVEEFDVFKSLHGNLLALEGWHERNIRHQLENRQELQKVSESPSQSYGFFKKQSKEERMEELRKLEHSLSIDVGIGNELLSLVYQVMHHHEIPFLKQIKKARFDKTIYEFSQSRIQELEKELLLWQTINLPDEAPEDDQLAEESNKIEKHDFRFTELPRTRDNQ